MADILKVLINASERAANIARSCCMESNDDSLFVAEKGPEGNSRFEKDYKTIADVLAQETAKAEIASRFPELANHVRGEECAEMGGVKVTLKSTTNETAEILGSLVNSSLAKLMAEAAHKTVKHKLCNNLPEDLPNIKPGDLGVWIDPIDATAEFIAGVRGEADIGGGLPCVTVLIGAYLRSTGEPVIGVINQPFYNKRGRILWGVHYKNISKWGGSDLGEYIDHKVVLMSGAEKSNVKENFQINGWDVKSVPGAGHKLLKVALGEATAYIVSQGTTYRWDTCAPHAIIRAKGGDLLQLSDNNPITYNTALTDDVQEHCNSGGIIAYTNISVLGEILNILH